MSLRKVTVDYSRSHMSDERRCIGVYSPQISLVVALWVHWQVLLLVAISLNYSGVELSTLSHGMHLPGLIPLNSLSLLSSRDTLSSEYQYFFLRPVFLNSNQDKSALYIRTRTHSKATRTAFLCCSCNEHTWTRNKSVVPNRVDLLFHNLSRRIQTFLRCADEEKYSYETPKGGNLVWEINSKLQQQLAREICHDKTSGELLHVDDLHIQCISGRLIEGLNFSLMPGQRLGLIGFNGAGKTTLLKVIAAALASHVWSNLHGSRCQFGNIELENISTFRGISERFSDNSKAGGRNKPKISKASRRQLMHQRKGSTCRNDTAVIDCCDKDTEVLDQQRRVYLDKLLAKEELEISAGDVSFSPSIRRLAFVQQEGLEALSPDDARINVKETFLSSLNRSGENVEIHQELLNCDETNDSFARQHADVAMRALSLLHDEAESTDRASSLGLATLRSMGFDSYKLAQPVGSLSGGERMLLQIASAIARRPQILLFDEPTNHCDSATSVAIRHLIQQLPFPCIIASHDPLLLDDVCDSFLLLQPKQSIISRGSNTFKPVQIPVFHGNLQSFTHHVEKLNLDWNRQVQEYQALLAKLKTQTSTRQQGNHTSANNIKLKLEEATRNLKEFFARKPPVLPWMMDLVRRHSCRKTPSFVLPESIHRGGEEILTLRRVTIAVPQEMEAENRHRQNVRPNMTDEKSFGQNSSTRTDDFYPCNNTSISDDDTLPTQVHYTKDELGRSFVDSLDVPCSEMKTFSILLKDVNLTIRRDSRIAILGPNGAGKSSLLAAIAGLLHPHIPHSNSQADKKLKPNPAVILQGERFACRSVLNPFLLGQQHADALPLNHTPLEILYEAIESAVCSERGNSKSLNEREALSSDDLYSRAVATAGRLGLRLHSLKIPAKCLSGGEKACLSIACCLLRAERCPLLLLDEPTNHLDATAAEALGTSLARFQGAVVMATHDPSFAAVVAREAVLVDTVEKCVTVIPISKLVGFKFPIRMDRQGYSGGGLDEFRDKFSEDYGCLDEMERRHTTGQKGGKEGQEVNKNNLKEVYNSPRLDLWKKEWSSEFSRSSKCIAEPAQAPINASSLDRKKTFGGHGQPSGRVRVKNFKRWRK